MDGTSIVLVTGANSGMGKATCIELAKTGAQIVMLCRNKQRGEEALADVRKSSGNKKVELMLCDLGSLKSINSFCDEFLERYDRLEVLINNAGVILPGRHETADGFELQFGVNHLGHFLLAKRLLELLIASAPARIINVSSGAHKAGRIYFDDVNLKANYSFIRAYAQSKLANVLFTNELSVRLKDKGITVNCLHPGAVATNIGINRETGFGTFITRLLKPFFVTPEQGAETSIYLATSPEVANVTGKYFYRKKPVATSKRANNKEDARKLWELSEKMIADKM
ncbi:MAG: SDR family oxidoreductase [Anaerobacillus sp.]|uniref:SDR family oxidoreductase n=1 Tax=Anaerobacillus sp. TaxID=1872506 RepID=UPI00391D0769